MFSYAESQHYDILLLDVQMGEMDGVALAKRVREHNEAVQIIFVTGYSDYIAEGYEVSALHYLMKPVDAEKLSLVLDKASSQLAKAERTVFFTVDGETVRIAASQVVSVEAFAHSCVVTMLRDRFEVKASISDVERMLTDGFTRCHRSYIVGIRHIKGVSKTEITLDNGQHIPLSRGNYDAVNQAFIRYFRGD